MNLAALQTLAARCPTCDTPGHDCDQQRTHPAVIALADALRDECQHLAKAVMGGTAWPRRLHRIRSQAYLAQLEAEAAQPQWSWNQPVT